MSLDKYLNFLQKYNDFTKEELSIVSSYVKVKKYTKNEFIHKAGDVCPALYFINYGLVRSFYIDKKGKEFTISFFFNNIYSQDINLFPNDYASFIEQKEGLLSLEVIEDCEVVEISYEASLNFRKMLSLIQFQRILLDKIFVYMQEREIEKDTKTAEERFNKLLKDMPFLFSKVPQYQIATFLGISPEYLSRLKNKSL